MVALRNRSGVSLIELVVVIGVMVLLTSYVIVYGVGGRRQTQLAVEEAKIGQLIARARSLSLATYTPTDRPCGYGVVVNYAANTYGLFKFKEYSPNKCSPVVQGNTLNDLDQDGASRLENISGETYTLSNEVVFDESQSDSLDRILFVRPNPDAYLFHDGTVWDETGRIYLEAKSGSLSRIIVVNQSGQLSL